MTEGEGWAFSDQAALPMDDPRLHPRPRRVLVVGRLPGLVPALGSRRFLLDGSLTVQGSRGDRWTVPDGFGTDLASVPQVFQWLVDDRGTYWLAAVVHDYLCAIARGQVPACRQPLHPICSCKGNRPPWIGRRDADGVFRALQRDEGVPLPLRTLTWAAVRVGSHLEGGLSRRDQVRLVAVLPVAAVVAVCTIPPMLGRWLVHGLGHLTDRLERPR